MYPSRITIFIVVLEFGAKIQFFFVICQKRINFAPEMEKFEEQLRNDLHQFLQSLNEVDERLPECPDVENKWEEIAKAYIPDGCGIPNGRSTRR